MQEIYENLKKAGVEVPGDNPKGGIYKPVMRVGNMLYVSGQGWTVRKGVHA